MPIPSTDSQDSAEAAVPPSAVQVVSPVLVPTLLAAPTNPLIPVRVAQ